MKVDSWLVYERLQCDVIKSNGFMTVGWFQISPNQAWTSQWIICDVKIWVKRTDCHVILNGGHIQKTSINMTPHSQYFWQRNVCFGLILELNGHFFAN